MTSRYKGKLAEGTGILCDNCKNSSTIQYAGTLPNGWFTVEDARETKVLFCSADCIIKKLSSRDSEGHDYGVVETRGFFTTLSPKSGVGGE